MSIAEFNRLTKKDNKPKPKKTNSSYIKKRRVCCVCLDEIVGAVLLVFGDVNPYCVKCIHKAPTLKLV